MDDLISIIIPIYNVEEYLCQCLDSVINQTYKNLDIICVNDCSSDNSLQIIKEYQQKDSRIALIDLKQNIGVGFARNEGIKVAKGKYIAFIDNDDWIKRDCIENFYNNIKKYDVDIIFNLHFNVIENKIEKEEPDFNLYNTLICSDSDKKYLLNTANLGTYFFPCWGKLFKRDFIIKNNLIFLTNRIEDFPFYWEFVIKAKSFIILEEYTYYYRRKRKNSITNTNVKKFLLYKIYSCKLLKKILKQINEYENYKVDFDVFVSRWIFAQIKTSKKISEIKKGVLLFRNHIFDNDFINAYFKAEGITVKLKLLLFYVLLKDKTNFSVSIFAFVLSVINKIKR